jgi:adenosine deaminase
MKLKEIVIEALPTSNVRIGHHRSFKTYHLRDWLNWNERDANVPPIVIGTDDTGIFATNIFNEYANLYQMLISSKKSARVSISAIKMLEENSLTYRFGDGYSDLLVDD